MPEPQKVFPLVGLNKPELQAAATALGASTFRGSQMVEWIYRRRVRDIDAMTNLPSAFRTLLKDRYAIGSSRVIKKQRAADGTVKLLLELGDGACVETVGLPYEDRYSCCVSTQAGCPIGCVFCATGQTGFIRNLDAGEIVDQVLTIAELSAHNVDHVTFMGMGEPLLNYEPTVKALRLLHKEIGISARHLTVSTIGHVPGIRRLAVEGLPVTLAVSLHAPTDELRHRLIPGMTNWSIAEIIDACRDYVSRTGRRLTVEYCLIEGVNDAHAQALQLSELLRGINCHVNLIPFNPFEGIPFKGVSAVRAKEFLDILSGRGVQVTARVKKGAEIDAACGQLRRRQGVDRAGSSEADY